MRAKIPNILSISRVVLGWLFLFVYSTGERTGYLAGIIVLGLAFTTDRMDGFLARRWNVVSERGYILDGLGDRAFTVSFVLMLVAQHAFSPVLAWLLVFREVLIYALRLLRTGDWYSTNAELRIFSQLHALGIRVWFLTYLIVDWGKLFRAAEIDRDIRFAVAQYCLLMLTLAISYYALARSILTTLRQAIEV